jgi:hypothetical protein
MSFPAAVIFINSDELTREIDGYYYTDGYYQDGYKVNPDGYINSITLNTLTTQLRINESMTFKEFNARVAFDPNYPNIVRLQGLRILVILPWMRDYFNRDLADVVLFYTHGQVVIEKNNFGPPGLSLPLDRINIYTLLREVGSGAVVILPPEAFKPKTQFGGSTVHEPNPDNEYNNPDWINRK